MSHSYANHFNVSYIEEMHGSWLQDPNSVAPDWRRFFEGMSFALEQAGPVAVGDDSRIHELIRGYRKWGHLSATLDPLGRPREEHDQLDLSQFGLSDSDLEKVMPTGGFLPAEHARLKELVAALRETWCGSVGVEYKHGADQDMESWFEQHIEPNRNRPNLTIANKRAILQKLNEAELLERFIHAKYTGQKRFSLEGGESFIPCLEEIINTLAESEASEVVIGMSHRGRLNVLANIMGKSYEDLFAEFEPNYQPDTVEGDGDVKYHKGYAADFATRSGAKVQITLADNPSHLEAVCPVVQGLVRAHQTMGKDRDRKHIVPVLVHGDASFSGQGIVSETLNMSQLEGYQTGGSIHIIINNQIGFTTDPSDGRSTEYCSDVARQILAPVFHVNGQDPEAVVHAARLACAFRQEFHRDVVIDLVCYRKHGHNESDEASFTQPLMYDTIKKMPTPRESYVAELIRQGDLEAKVARELEQSFKNKLEEALALARSGKVLTKKPEGAHYSTYRPTTDAEIFAVVETAVDSEILNQVAEGMTAIPGSFQAHRKARRLMDNRRKQILDGERIDWGSAETLAYGSLLVQGYPVRLSGQDVRRGTFSHRHAVLWDMENGSTHTGLNHLQQDQAHFSVFNSHLSELAVLGFEFGYSLARPKALVIWEAQFGDFSNGAQIIIDQFISSSESKWNRISDLVMFLPHGYEGQGPEHSSARLERYLQLCAENNIQVANLTEPAQLFHILRRQVLRDYRKPLVIMTPKSLLRHEDCVSGLDQFTSGRFREIIADSEDYGDAERLLLCSGKLYYDLKKKRTESGSKHVAIVRIEQLYPFAAQQLEAIRKAMPKLKDVVWVQEESRNMGAWSFVEPYLRDLFGQVRYLGRDASASPAVGSLAKHRLEQESILTQAFGK